MVVQKVGLFCGCRGRKSDGSAAGVWVVIGWLGAACDCLVWLGCVGLWFGVRGISVWTAFVKLWLVVWGVGFQCASWFAAVQVILGDAYVRGRGDC